MKARSSDGTAFSTVKKREFRNFRGETSRDVREIPQISVTWADAFLL